MTTGGWTVCVLSGDQRIQHVFKACGGSIDVSYPHMGMDLFGCQTVPIGRDKYVICSVSLFVHMVAAAVDALCELET